MAATATRNSIRSVIFDFGGVLVRWRPEEIVRDFYADPRLRAALKKAVFQHPDWAAMDRGTLGEERAALRFAERMDRPVEEMRQLLERVRDSLIPIAESFAIVRSLAARGIPVYALSNMPASTFAYLRARYDCWDAFQGIVISGEIGMIKPEPDIFDYIARRYAIVPSQTVFVDDHLPNIESGARLGFRTIHFWSPQQCAAELRSLLGGETPAPPSGPPPVPQSRPPRR